MSFSFISASKADLAFISCKFSLCPTPFLGVFCLYLRIFGLPRTSPPILGGPVWSQKLDSMIPTGPFQLGIFYGSVISPTLSRHTAPLFLIMPILSPSFIPVSVQFGAVCHSYCCVSLLQFLCFSLNSVHVPTDIALPTASQRCRCQPASQEHICDEIQAGSCQDSLIYAHCCSPSLAFKGSYSE